MGFELPRQQRLVSSREIQDVLSGSTASRNYGAIRAVRRINTVSQPRLGIGISKRHVKSAVRRNLIKRIIREWFRLHQTGFGNWDVMVLSTRRLQTMDSSLTQKKELRQALDQLATDLARD